MQFNVITSLLEKEITDLVALKLSGERKDSNITKQAMVTVPGWVPWEAALVESNEQDVYKGYPGDQHGWWRGKKQEWA